MSSNATFDSRKQQVSEAICQRQLKGVNEKKSKCSKSSGSLAKTVVCSSCDDGEISEHDAEKRALSTSDPSSTNVIFFKDITDSSTNVSMDEQHRVPLRPGKRRSICSKLGMQRKVKVFKGLEGMEDSLENFCELHKQLRLKIPEKQQSNRRPTSPEVAKFRRSSPQKGDRLVRIKRPSTAGVVNDVPPTKYPESIFKVFMQPQQKIVKKRLIPISHEDSSRSQSRLTRPVKKASRNLIEEGFLDKKKATVNYGKQKEQQKASANDQEEKQPSPNATRPALQAVMVEETVENVEIRVKKSKSTIKTHDPMNPVTSKRSVHWEDEMLQGKNKETSGEAETWKMECQKRANRIRRTFQNLDGKSAHPVPVGQAPESHDSKLARYSKTLDKFGTKYSEIVVQSFKFDSKPTAVSKLQGSGSDCEAVKVRRAKPKGASSSESEILRRRSRRYRSETSEEETEEKSHSSLRNNSRTKTKLRERDSDTDRSCSSQDEECKSTHSEIRRSRRMKRASDELVLLRRTSSPAILKTKDSRSLLVRGKSSPAMSRKLKLQQSKSTISSSSPRSESSQKDNCDWFGTDERSHQMENKCLYEQARLKQNIDSLSDQVKQDNHILSEESVNKTPQETGYKRKPLKNPPKLARRKSDLPPESNVLCSFKECLKETEECLEKLKFEIQKPDAKDRTELIKSIRSKLTKIRHQVETGNTTKSISKKNDKTKSKLQESTPESISCEVGKIILENEISFPTKKAGEIPVEKTKISPPGGKPKSPINYKKIIPHSERSRQILESWESTEKSIGERSEKLLKTIRTMREKKLALVVNLEKGSENAHDSGTSAENIASSRKERSNEIMSKGAKQSLGPGQMESVEKEQRSESEETLLQSEGSDNKYFQTSSVLRKKSSSVFNEDLIEVSSSSKHGAIIHVSNETQSMKVSPVNTPTNEVENSKSLEFPTITPNFILVGEINAPNNEIIEEYKKYPNKNKSDLDLKRQSNCSMEGSENRKESDDSGLSSPSLEHVTSASIESLPDVTTAYQEVRIGSTTTSPRPSPPPSRYSTNTTERSRTPANRSTRSTQDRPPSRKPFFDRNSSEEAVESAGTSLSHIRIQSHQPRSRNTPASTRIHNDRPLSEGTAKKPPPSRMYSTLKETPFTKKESIKSAIKDLSLTPKSSQRRVTLSSPPTANSTSSHKVSEASRPSTAKKERMSSFGKVVSVITPSSLEILKKKTIANRERNASSRPTTSDTGRSGASSDSTKISNRNVGQENFFKKRMASLTRSSTPLGIQDINVNRPKSGVALNRIPTPTVATPPTGSPLRKSAVQSAHKKHVTLRVTFEDDNPKQPKEPEIRHLLSNKKLPLSKRLPNYRPPWERVDLRPPESALAERALHEKRLFGGPRSLKRRSEADRPQTPGHPSSDWKPANKTTNKPISGTTTNSTLTVNTRDVPRHDSESDCPIEGSPENTSSYDTAQSSVQGNAEHPTDEDSTDGERRLDTTDFRGIYLECTEWSPRRMLKSSASEEYSNPFYLEDLRKSSSMNTSQSSDLKTFKSSSVQTVIEKDHFQERKKSQIKVNVSVKTCTSGTSLECCL